MIFSVKYDIVIKLIDTIAEILGKRNPNLTKLEMNLHSSA